MEYEEPSKNFEVLLTSDQMKALNDIMPVGYSIACVGKPNRREGSSKSSKKVQLESASSQKKQLQINTQTSGGNITNLNDSNLQQFNQQYQQQQMMAGNSTTLSKQPSQGSPTSAHSKDSKRNLRTKRTKVDAKTLDLDNMHQPNKFKGLSDELKKCNKILQLLKKHNYAQPFLQPVDPVELNCHDYFDVIKEPLDLQTIDNQLRAGMYISSQQFIVDVRKVWNNSLTYNQKGSPIYQMTIEMQTYFEKLNKDYFESPPAIQANSSVLQLQKQVEKLSKELKELNNNKGRSGKGSKKSKNSTSKLDTPMTMAEKRNLGQQIRTLPPENLKGVWEIVSNGNLNNSNREVLEFDIDTLPARKTRELEQYVKQKLAQLQKKSQKKKAPKQSMKQMEQLQMQQQAMQEQLAQGGQMMPDYGMQNNLNGGYDNQNDLIYQQQMQQQQMQQQQQIVNQQQQIDQNIESEEQSESFLSDSEEEN